MEIINKLYFSIAVFSLIVFVDLMIKFKRPLILKIYLGILTLTTGLNAFIFTIDVPPHIFLYASSIAKGLMAFSIINIFTVLYFPKYQKWINLLGFFYVIYEVLLFKYVFDNPHFFANYPQSAMIMLLKTKIALPLYMNIYRIVLTFAFLAAMLYTSGSVLFKQNYQNIYFDKIKTWSRMLVYFTIFMFLLFAPVSFVELPELFSYTVSIISFILIE
ncbi:MAG: hypothetical protein RLZZ546_1542, partial [Bacteroidota bacterium]